jgi:hypothetical protein
MWSIIIPGRLALLSPSDRMIAQMQSEAPITPVAMRHLTGTLCRNAYRFTMIAGTKGRNLETIPRINRRSLIPISCWNQHVYTILTCQAISNQIYLTAIPLLDKLPSVRLNRVFYN